MHLALVSTLFGDCFRWNPVLVWLYVATDAGIAITSTLLSVFLIYLHRRSRHTVPYPGVLLGSALVGIFCTAGYALDIYTIWFPSCNLSSVKRLSTAAICLYTACLIRPVIPEVLSLIDKYDILATTQHESDAKFKDAFDHATVGMALIKPDGHWLEVNQSLCEIVGCSEEELLTRTLQDITHPEDVEHDLEYLQEILEGKRDNFQIEKRFHRKNGRIVWVLISISLVRNSAGHPLYFIHQIENITKRKTIEYGMIDLTAQLYSEIGELKSQELSKRVEKILEEAELFEGFAIKMRKNDVY